MYKVAAIPGTTTTGFPNITMDIICIKTVVAREKKNTLRLKSVLVRTKSVILQECLNIEQWELFYLAILYNIERL